MRQVLFVRRHMPQASLDNACFLYDIVTMHRSFRLAWGTNAPLYAADVVLAATALLEAPPATRAGEGTVRDDRSDCIWCAPFNKGQGNLLALNLQSGTSQAWFVSMGA